jgi:hypothetical protein
VVGSLVQMGTNWLESMMFVFTLDFRELHKTFPFHYYLNWRWFRLSCWECNGESGAYERERRKNLCGFEQHGDKGTK